MTKARATSLNEELERRYARAWLRIRELPKTSGLSCPHFVKIHPNYLASRRRLLIVGQETSQWQPPGGDGLRSRLGPHPVRTLMDLYEGFSLGTHYRRTPFWDWAAALHERLNGATGPHGYLWSNLIKMDRKLSGQGARLSPTLEDEVCDLGLLQTEIELAEPEVIVFLTGPRYEGRLRRSLEAVSSPVSGFAERQLARLALPELAPSARIFRTYHPAYFRRARQTALGARILDAIARETQ